MGTLCQLNVGLSQGDLGVYSHGAVGLGLLLTQQVVVGIQRLNDLKENYFSIYIQTMVNNTFISYFKHIKKVELKC